MFRMPLARRRLSHQGRQSQRRPWLEQLEDRTVPTLATPVLATPARIPVGAPPGDLLAADFNNDGNLDLVFTKAGQINVLHGNGNGTFQPAVTSPGYAHLRWKEAVDFNGDGQLDLVGIVNGGAQVLLGNGDASFTTGASVSIGLEYADVYDVASADLNGDGSPDLLGSWYHFDEETFEGRWFLSVRLNNGDGTFAAPESGDYPWLEFDGVGDFNEDGHLDVVASGHVLLGNGDGTLQAAAPAINGKATHVGDFNGDGHLDLLGQPYDGSDNRRYDALYLGNGDGSFQAARLIDLLGSQSNAFSYGGFDARTVGDFNADGHLDVVANEWGGSIVSLCLGVGNGEFLYPQQFAISGADLISGDVDHDGDVDLMVSDNSANAIVVYLNANVWPVAPTATISDVGVVEGDTGTTDAVFTVTLSAAASVPVSLSFRTELRSFTTSLPNGSVTYGSASAGSDYLATTGVVTFAPGETTKTIVVTVIGDDAMVEYDYSGAEETFAVRLLNPTNALVVDGYGVGTIINDDETTITATVADVSMAEGHAGTSTMQFLVTLSRPSLNPFVVNYYPYDLSVPECYSDDPASRDYPTGSWPNADYHWAAGTVTIQPGATTGYATVTIFGDRRVEASERFGLYAYCATGFDQAVGRIVDDDAATARLGITDVTRTEGKNGKTAFVFTVTLNANYWYWAGAAKVTVSWRTEDGTAKAGSDYVAASGTLTFKPGETSKTITVNVNGDGTREADETFYVRLFNASANAWAEDELALATILNDD